MTLDEFIEEVNILYEGDTTPPESGEEDYELWAGLGRQAVDIWENEEGVLWRELFTTLDEASDGDKVIIASTYDYDCPSDFKFPVGFVRTVDSEGNSTYYRVVSPDKVQLLDGNGENWCYFTGNENVGYTLHFNPKLSLNAGNMIKYEYYKKAIKPTKSTDKFEMSDPMFAVYWAVAELKKEEGNAEERQIALNKLRAMKLRNMMVGKYQENVIEDKASVLGAGGFGV